MNTKWIVGLAVAGTIALIGLVTLVTAVGIYNAQSSLQNTYEMKIKANESDFDNMFKKIRQSVQIPEAKKDAFRDIFTAYAGARTSEGQGRVMAWVKESAPNVDLSTYDNVLNIINGSRDSWTSRQKELVDLAREYNQNLVVFPKNIFLKFCGFQKIDPKIVTSTKTEEAFKTGKDDDVELFKKK